MGNTDGLMSAVVSHGTNQVITLNKDCYFSFAFGNEIAFVDRSFKEGNPFWILNCSSELLWKQVKAKVKKAKNIKSIKKWWKSKLKHYKASDWSQDFKKL